MRRRSAHKKLACFGVMLAVLWLGLFVRPCWASEPGRFVLSDFSLEYRDGMLLVSLGIGVEDTEALRIMLKDGAQMELSGEIRIVRPRILLPNTFITEREFVFFLRHDTLTRDFELRLPPPPPPQRPTGGSSPVFRNKQLALLLASTVERLLIPVAPVASFENGVNYRVELSLSLRHTDVPPWLSRTLLFWSWDVVPSASYSKDFIYEAQP